MTYKDKGSYESAPPCMYKRQVGEETIGECVAVCCDVLQCVAVCCSVLQCVETIGECVAVCCDVV